MNLTEREVAFDVMNVFDACYLCYVSTVLNAFKCLRLEVSEVFVFKVDDTFEVSEVVEAVYKLSC